MRSRLWAIPLAVWLAASAGAAGAKGCLKGAAVGTVAGHVMGRHALVGAAAGCVIGHHLANKPPPAAPPQANRAPALPPAPADAKLRT